MKSTANKKIRYSDKNILPPDEFADRNVKIRITTMIDLDVLKAIKAAATRQHMPYQTLLNETLRRVFVQSSQSQAEFTETERKLLREMIAERLELLPAAPTKKRA